MIPPRLSATVVPGEPTGGVPGPTAGRAYGNPGVVSGNNPNPLPGDSSTNNRVVALGVGQETAWRGGAAPAAPGVNKMTTHDRSVMAKQGFPRTGLTDSTPGNPPNPDGPSSGPPRPVYAQEQRSLSFQMGSDATANQDAARPYSMSQPLPDRSGQRWGSRVRPDCTIEPGPQYVGEQGNGWSPVYGGTPGLWQPYGSYGGYTARDVKGIQAPFDEGQPGDGPHKVFGGPPHGLHSQTYPSYDNTLGRYMAVPQMRAPRVDRPANSPIAGQDYSQTVQPQGESGTVVQNPNRFASRSRFATG